MPSPAESRRNRQRNSQIHGSRLDQLANGKPNPDLIDFLEQDKRGTDDKLAHAR